VARRRPEAEEPPYRLTSGGAWRAAGAYERDRPEGPEAVRVTAAVAARCAYVGTRWTFQLDRDGGRVEVECAGFLDPRTLEVYLQPLEEVPDDEG
jgi:hypothetical protein